MELLNEIKFFDRTGKIPANCIREAILNQALFEDMLEEDGADINTPERVDVLNKINNDTFVKNNYQAFADEIKRNKRAEFLTPYTPEELADAKVQTFQVPGYEIGFGLKPLPNGFDIIGVHNNTNIKGIGEALIDAAKRLGGTHLDHYDGFLSDFYKKKGFNEYDRWDWNDEYAPANWNYEKYGKPQVVLRSILDKP